LDTFTYSFASAPGIASSICLACFVHFITDNSTGNTTNNTTKDSAHRSLPPFPKLFPKIPPVIAPLAAPIPAPLCVLFVFFNASQLVKRSD
jgi:hypothetical protein